MPIEPAAWGVTHAGLADLIGQLLVRDPAQRLGASSMGGASAVKEHPFLSSIDWRMLAASALPAPFLPDPNLVYAKDNVPPLSEDDHPKKPITPPSSRLLRT